MNKEIHINPAKTTTYAANRADTTYILDKGATFDPIGNSNGIAADAGVVGRNFDIRGTVKGNVALSIGDYFSNSGGGDLKVTASGSILGDFTGVTTAGKHQTIENAGHIEGATFGGVIMQGGQSHLLNTGNISSDMYGVTITGNSSMVENHGRIISTDDAIRLDSDGSRLTNTGLISSNHFGAALGGDHSVIANHGSIIGSSAGVYIHSNGDDERHIVRNDDHITGPYAIWGSDDQDVIRNSGSLSGIVMLRGGDDVFDGRGGESPDGINGGGGDDLYIISKPMALVEDANGGNDTVKVSVSFTLPENFEVLRLTGNENADATGNGSFNTIRGNSGANVIDGGGGGDIMFGGDGADTFVFKGGYGQAAVLDMQAAGKGHDVVDFAGTDLHSFADVMAHLTETGSGVQIALSPSDTLFLDHLQTGDLHASDFSF